MSEHKGCVQVPLFTNPNLPFVISVLWCTPCHRDLDARLVRSLLPLAHSGWLFCRACTTGRRFCESLYTSQVVSLPKRKYPPGHSWAEIPSDSLHYTQVQGLPNMGRLVADSLELSACHLCPVKAQTRVMSLFWQAMLLSLCCSLPRYISLPRYSLPTCFDTTHITWAGLARTI